MEQIRDIFVSILGAIFFIIAVILIIKAAKKGWRQIQEIEIPANAGLTETLQHVPFWLMIVIDILDALLDTLSAPIVFIILRQTKFKSLRNLAVVESVIPFTQLIPALSTLWLLVNVLNVKFLDRLFQVLDFTFAGMRALGIQKKDQEKNKH